MLGVALVVPAVASPVDPDERTDAVGTDLAVSGPSLAWRTRVGKSPEPLRPAARWMWVALGYQLNPFGLPDLRTAAPMLVPWSLRTDLPIATVRLAVGYAPEFELGPGVGGRLGVGFNAPQLVQAVEAAATRPCPDDWRKHGCAPRGAWLVVNTLSGFEFDARIVANSQGPMRIVAGVNPRLHLAWNTYGYRSPAAILLLLANPAVSAEWTW